MKYKVNSKILQFRPLFVMDNILSRMKKKHKTIIYTESEGLSYAIEESIQYFFDLLNRY